MRRLGRPDEGVHSGLDGYFTTTHVQPAGRIRDPVCKAQCVNSIRWQPPPTPEHWKRKVVHVLDEALIADTDCFASIRPAHELPEQGDTPFDARIESRIEFRVALLREKLACGGRGGDRDSRPGPRPAGWRRVPYEALDEYTANRARRLTTGIRRHRSTKQSHRRQRRDHGLEIVMVTRHGAVRKTKGSHEASGELLDDPRWRAAMPRQRVEPCSTPCRRRETLAQPIAPGARFQSASAIIDKRDIRMEQKCSEYVDAEPNPAKEGRRVRHAMGPGLARRAGCVFGSAPHPRPIRGCGRIPPPLRAIHRDRRDAMLPGEEVDGSGQGSRCQFRPGPRDRRGNGFHDVAVVEPDQRRTDVAPAAAGEVNSQHASRMPIDGHVDPFVRTAHGSAADARRPAQGRAKATSSLAMSSQPTVAMMYCRPPTM